VKEPLARFHVTLIFARVAAWIKGKKRQLVGVVENALRITGERFFKLSRAWLASVRQVELNISCREQESGCYGKAQKCEDYFLFASHLSYSNRSRHQEEAFD